MSFSDVVEHYRLRGFSRAAVAGLLDEMKAKIEGEILVIDEHLSRPLSGLPQAFSPVVQVQIEHRDLPPVSAILAFAFGYRLKSRAAPGAERQAARETVAVPVWPAAPAISGQVGSL